MGSLRKSFHYANLAVFLLAHFVADLNSAYARGGDSGGGGSNSFENRVVESYNAEDLTEMKGYSLFKEKLERVREAAPRFAELLEAQIKKYDWYNIPETLPGLSKEQTGLPTGSAQDCLQDSKTKQIFCDSRIRELMPEASAARQIMHELAMSLKTDKSSWKTRRLVGKIFAKNSAPLDIQNALAESEFGFYLSEPQKAVQLSHARTNYLSGLEFILANAERSCERGAPFSEIQRRLIYRVDFDKAPEIPVSYEALTKNDMRSSIISPFAKNVWGWRETVMSQGLYLSGASTCKDLKKQYGEEQCKEFFRFQDIAENETELERFRGSGAPSNSPDMKFMRDRAIELSKEVSQDRELREQAFRSMIEESGTAMNREVAKLLAELSREPAFLNILALQVTDEKEFALRRANWWPTKDPASAWVIFGKILESVEARHRQLNPNDRGGNRTLLCNSISAAKKNVSSRLAAEIESQKNGTLNPPASSYSAGAPESGAQPGE